MENGQGKKYAVVEMLMAKAKCGDNDAMAELIERMEPLIITCCRRYFGYMDEDLMQMGRMKCIMLVREFDVERDIRILGYMKSMLSYYFWDIKKKDIRLTENETSMTQENENYVQDRPVIEMGYGWIEIEDLLNGLTEKERYVVLENIIGQEKLVDVAKSLSISYDYSKDIKKSAISKLRKVIKSS